MITFVTFKWKPTPGYRSQFTGEHVNIWGRMISRHYHKEHRLVCVTDDPEGIDQEIINVMPLWPDHAQLSSPHGNQRHYPSCYRRLRLFSKEAEQMFGSRIVQSDLDIVITDDITSLLDRDEDVVFWGDTARNTHYNGSFYLLRTGSRPQVWEQFDPFNSPAATLRLGMVGSDQAWISYVLGDGETKWTNKDGILSFRIHVKPQGTKYPTGAKIIVFHGHSNPWDLDIQKRYQWIRDHYR